MTLVVQLLLRVWCLAFEIESVDVDGEVRGRRRDPATSLLLVHELTYITCLKVNFTGSDSILPLVRMPCLAIIIQKARKVVLPSLSSTASPSVNL